VKVAVAGAAGYVGGELLRLLLGHPAVEVVQATSDRHAGQPIHAAHPNLRRLTSLRFSPHEELGKADALFLARPHGVTLRAFDDDVGRAPLIVDLSADFRLHDQAAFSRHYGGPHPRPEVAARFVPGLPELYRERLGGAAWISVPGCMATAAILALHPLVAEELIAGDVLVDARTGSSGAGAEATRGSHHAERSGALRIYEPTDHRHGPEIAQACGIGVRMTVTAVDAVRGVQVVIHARPTRALRERDLWDVYRRRYGREPFIRLVGQRSGLYRYPEPKVLAGSNFCDIGFAVDPGGGRVVLISALDNLVKGGAGSAVQSFNVAIGADETAALTFPGLHPI
jgi:N-acetyl-gamma-glutamyl-phosphate/LysW-gamma-L-alpha-aminoadipyl-6-phosphate reductase